MGQAAAFAAQVVHGHVMSKCGFATLLIPRGGRPTYFVGLGASMSKCGFATLLIPRGGRPTYVVGLGALFPHGSCHHKCRRPAESMAAIKSVSTPNANRPGSGEASASAAMRTRASSADTVSTSSVFQCDMA